MISVVVPVYNSEKWLERCVKSIAGNTYKELQIILVDDGSTDASGELCEKFALQDSRMQVVHKENGGQNSARLAGIRVSKGEYISFVDSDDWIDSDYYENLFNQNNDCDLVTSGVLFEESGKSIAVYDGLEPGVYCNMEYVLRNFLINHVGSGSGLNNNMFARLWRTNVVKEIADKCDIGIRIGEDWYFTILFMLKAKSVSVTRYCGYHYVENPSSAMHSRYDSYLIDQNRFYDSVKNVLNGFYLEPEMMQDFQVRFMKDLITNTPIMLGFNYQFGIDMDLINTLSGKTVCLFGAGKLGRFYFNQLSEQKNIKIALWCDNKPDANAPLYTVSPPERIKDFDFDFVLVAVVNKDSFAQIKSQLLSMGILKEKILWKNRRNTFF